MQEELFDSIEEDLNKLLTVLTEEEYISFVEEDRIMKIFEMVVELPNKYDVLTNDILKRISKYINLKLCLYY